VIEQKIFVVYFSVYGIPFNTFAEFNAVAVAKPVWNAGASKTPSSPLNKKIVVKWNFLVLNYL